MKRGKIRQLIPSVLGILLLGSFAMCGRFVERRQLPPQEISNALANTPTQIEKPVVPPTIIEPSVKTPRSILQPTLNLEKEGVYLGVSLPGIPGPMSNLTQYESQVGKNVALVHWFQAWGSEDKDFDKGMIQALWEHGVITLISWEPWERTMDYQKPQPDFQLSNIAEGKFDPYIRKWAQEIKSLNIPVLIRFAHEMDGNWYPWSVGMNNNQSKDYVAAWKHIWNIFQEEGANAEVQWVWSPNWNREWTVEQFRKIYPGDEYVDWIGMSIFNWGTTVPRHKWDSLEERLSWRYQKVLEYGKPIVIAEFASDETGGSKTQWIREAFQFLKESYPQVRAILWFNLPTARYSTKVRWAVDSSPEALEAFREAIKDPYFLGPQFKEVISQN